MLIPARSLAVSSISAVLAVNRSPYQALSEFDRALRPHQGLRQGCSDARDEHGGDDHTRSPGFRSVRPRQLGLVAVCAFDKHILRVGSAQAANPMNGCNAQAWGPALAALVALIALSVVPSCLAASSLKIKSTSVLLIKGRGCGWFERFVRLHCATGYRRKRPPA